VSTQESAASAKQVAKLQDSGRNLEQQLQRREQTIRVLEEEKSGLQKRKSYLDDMTAWFTTQSKNLTSGAFDEHVALTRSKGDLELKLKAAANDNTTLNCRLRELRTEIHTLAQANSTLQAEVSFLGDNTPHTLRSLIGLRILEADYYLNTKGQANHPEGSASLIPKPPPDFALGSREILDNVLDPAALRKAAAAFAQNPSVNRFCHDSLVISRCMKCRKLKLRCLEIDTDDVPHMHLTKGLFKS
jgi:hypothetical protein